jgi:hypothetical protein
MEYVDFRAQYPRAVLPQKDNDAAVMQLNHMITQSVLYIVGKVNPQGMSDLLYIVSEAEREVYLMYNTMS